MPDDIKHPHLKGAYDEMAGASTLPLWEIYHKLVSDKPAIHGAPHLWSYAQLRPLLMNAGTQITAAEAERRVLVLKHPAHERPGIAQTLFAGLQLVMPGEIAEAHRHSQGALRLVLESSGGYTAVEGERCEMRRGDFITTPSWCWHDHKNTGDGPMIWLDGLDVPLVNFFGAKFAEECATAEQPIYRKTDDSVSRWGSGLRPFAGQHIHPYSPVFSYPYAQAKAALDGVAASDAPDPHRGWKMIYTNPRDGGHALPTIAAYLQKLPAGFTTKASQTTEAQVYTALEGRGTARIGETTLAFEENDTFVVPNWMEFQIECGPETVLFSFTDRAAQENLGIWRSRDL